MIPNSRCCEEKCPPTEPDSRQFCDLGVRYGLLTLLDWAINILILCPLNVMYWRGLWGFLDDYILPGRVDQSAYVSIGLGYSVSFFCYMIQIPLTRYLTDLRRNYLGRLVASRFFTVLFSFGLINEWRGVWQTLDHHFGRSWESAAICTSIGALVLACLGTLRNIIASPLGMATDHLDDGYAAAPTMFKMIKLQRSVWYIVLDVAFSVMIVGFLVAFVWRGIWNMLDAFLFPEAAVTSMWTSLAIGHAIILVALSIQYRMAAVSRCLKTNISRILFEDTFILVASFGDIMVWRGFWNLSDLFILPDNRILSCGITCSVGLIGSMLLFAGNTVLARGVYRDGEHHDGSGCIFATSYLRKLSKQHTKPHVSNENKFREQDGILEQGSPSMGSADAKLNGGTWKDEGHIPLKIMVVDGRSSNCDHPEESTRLTAIIETDM